MGEINPHFKTSKTDKKSSITVRSTQTPFYTPEISADGASALADKDGPLTSISASPVEKQLKT